MKYQSKTYNVQRTTTVFVLFTLYAVLLILSGCIRLTGSAGYTKVKDDEVVTKSTGFDLDSSRLVDQRGVS